MSDSESEVELHAEVGLPDWLPVSATVGARYRRLSRQRIGELNSSLESAADLSPSEIEQRILENDEIADIYRRAAERVAGVADQTYRDSIARLVSAAFADKTKVLEVDHLADQVVHLQPLHLRVLRAMFPSAPGAHIGGPYVSAADLTHALGLDQDSTALGALKVLEAAGFVTPQDDPATGRRHGEMTYFGTWRATHWGLRAMVLCGTRSDWGGSPRDGD